MPKHSTGSNDSRGGKSFPNAVLTNCLGLIKLGFRSSRGVQMGHMYETRDAALGGDLGDFLSTFDVNRREIEVSVSFM